MAETAPFQLYPGSNASPTTPTETPAQQKDACAFSQARQSGDCIPIINIEDSFPVAAGPRPIVPGPRVRLEWQLPKQLRESRRVRTVIRSVTLAVADSTDAPPPAAKVSPDATTIHLRGGKTPLYRSARFRLSSSAAKYIRFWTTVLDRAGTRIQATTFLYELKNGIAYRLIEAKKK